MTTVEKLDKSRVKLTIEISAEAFDDALSKAYFKTKGRYSMPGFRKGKAPRKVIESMYGEGVFYEDAFDILYPEAYKTAISENGVEPVEQPDLSIEQIEKGQPLIFVAEVDVYPEVSLGAYKGIEVIKREYTVEDAEVNDLIEKEREKLTRFVDQDRPVQEGDQVVLDYSGSIDGVKFDGGTAEKYALVIGSHTFIPGFEEQLIGMAKGEEKDVVVTFPEEYHSKELAGKEAVFHVLIHEIQIKELPELDDEFAQDISEFDTLSELIEDKRKALEKRNADRIKMETEDEAIKGAIDNAKFEIPEAMINRQIEQLMRDMQYRLAMSGISLEQYCQYTGMDINKMRADYRETATERVSTHLTLEAIAKAEGFEPTEEDIDKELADYCEKNNIDVEEFKKTNKGEEREYLAERWRVEKAIGVVMDNCVYVEAKEEKKPAKKAAKKDEAGKMEKAEAPAKKTASKDAAEKPEKAETPAKKKAAKKPDEASPAEPEKE